MEKGEVVVVSAIIDLWLCLKAKKIENNITQPYFFTKLCPLLVIIRIYSDSFETIFQLNNRCDFVYPFKEKKNTLSRGKFILLTHLLTAHANQLVDK